MTSRPVKTNRPPGTHWSPIRWRPGRAWPSVPAVGWIAPDVERSEHYPARRNEAEREMLRDWLDWHRATLLRKCAGLDGTSLASRSVPPSNLSLLGLVRHMSDVERG